MSVPFMMHTRNKKWRLPNLPHTFTKFTWNMRKLMLCIISKMSVINISDIHNLKFIYIFIMRIFWKPYDMIFNGITYCYKWSFINVLYNDVSQLITNISEASTLELQQSLFNFFHITRVLNHFYDSVESKL